MGAGKKIKTFDAKSFDMNVHKFFRLCNEGNLSMAQKFYREYRVHLYLSKSYILHRICLRLNIAKWLRGLPGNFSEDALHDAFRNASREGHLDVIKWFSENYNSVPNFRNITFFFSCIYGHLHVVKWLINNCDINIPVINNGLNQSFRLGHNQVSIWLLSQYKFRNQWINNKANLYNKEVIAILYKQGYIATNPILKLKYTAHVKSRIKYFKQVLRIFGRFIVIYYEICEKRYSCDAIGYLESKNSFDSCANVGIS
ncbi:MAG: hypothetical protein Harvfovirus5_26 [Harvfovirus sp.]|uniref:Ankyrin repeat protein n=1 Tax=Harvfovirus sp. TaxID=2487768 RepID=A0A3G5A0M7_9VIRU|nr:MAG: hypothetical protein Harvfovirus5_26 [Harvfovirus sp.]